MPPCDSGGPASNTRAEAPTSLREAGPGRGDGGGDVSLPSKMPQVECLGIERHGLSFTGAWHTVGAHEICVNGWVHPRRPPVCTS